MHLQRQDVDAICKSKQKQYIQCVDQVNILLEIMVQIYVPNIKIAMMLMVIPIGFNRIIFFVNPQLMFSSYTNGKVSLLRVLPRNYRDADVKYIFVILFQNIAARVVIFKQSLKFWLKLRKFTIINIGHGFLEAKYSLVKEVQQPYFLQGVHWLGCDAYIQVIGISLYIKRILKCFL